MRFGDIKVVGSEQESFAFQIPGETGIFDLLSGTMVRIIDCGLMSAEHIAVVREGGFVGTANYFWDIGYSIRFHMLGGDHYLNKSLMMGATLEVIE